VDQDGTSWTAITLFSEGWYYESDIANPMDIIEMDTVDVIEFMEQKRSFLDKMDNSGGLHKTVVDLFEDRNGK